MGLMEELEGIYSRKCSICGGYHDTDPLPSLSASNEQWDSLLDRIAKELFDEKISKGFIDQEIYERTAASLIKAAHEGLGGVQFAYDDERNILKAYLEQNIYKFSAAKDLAELETFRGMMLNEKGEIVDFVTFRNRVAETGNTFNETYLKTEYDTAYQSALMALKWDNLSQSSEYLEYSTAGDDRVRPTHAALDGLTLPVESPVWNTIWPPIDWNCRCTIVPGVADKVTMTDKEAGKLGDFIAPYFRNNSGKTKTTFKDDHPYFVNANFKEKQLDAVKNYGLRTPEQIFADVSKLPPIKTMESPDEFANWWKESLGEAAVKVDVVNNSVFFDQGVKDHLLQKNSEKRFTYGANIIDTLQKPNEIWSNRDKNNRLVNFYIKYYQDGAYVLIVTDKENSLQTDTFYKLTDKRLVELRKGILRYRK